MASSTNQNTARSKAMRLRLIDATIESLVAVGYASTTGVEVCKRAGVTRGALNHHFPALKDLMVATLDHINTSLARSTNTATGDPDSLEDFVRANYQRVIQPNFKAMIELWLASKNDTETGTALTQAIKEASSLFAIENRFPNSQGYVNPQGIYYTVREALIGIGLGRATNGGKASPHELLVLDTLLNLVRTSSSTKNNLRSLK